MTVAFLGLLHQHRESLVPCSTGQTTLGGNCGEVEATLPCEGHEQP